MRKITILFMAVVFAFSVNAQNPKNGANIRASKSSVAHKTTVTNNAKDITSVTFLNESFESATFPPTGWALLSPDGGTGWMRVTAGTTPMPGWQGGTISVPANGGTACAYCSWSTGGAASNDQWLITPQLANVQANDTIKFWCRRSPITYLEELQIKISTGTAAAPADFTIAGPTFAFPAASGDSAWTQYAIPIGALVPAGSNVYVGFREVVADNEADGASISLDKITWGALPTTPTASCSPQTWAAGNIVVGSSVTSPSITLQNTGGGTLTVSGITGLSAPYTTTLVPASVSLAADQSATFTFTFAPTAAGAANQTVTIATNAGDITISLTGSGVDCSIINTFPWSESFEGVTFPPACWTKESPDGGTGWASVASGTTPLPGWNGGTMTTPTSGGNNAVYATWNTGGTSSNDQWLITPQFAIPTGKSLFFYVYRFGSYQDLLDIKASTTNNQSASFGTTLMTLDSNSMPSAVWAIKEVNLSSLSGQNAYFAFNEHISDNTNDGAFIALDLVSIDNVNNISESTKELVSVFPNPASNKLYIAANQINTVEIYNLTGAKVASFGNQNVINISDLAQGTYLVKIVTDNKVTTQKINIVR